MFIEWPMAVPLIDTTGQAVNKTEFLASQMATSQMAEDRRETCILVNK